MINCLQSIHAKFETQQSKNESALEDMPLKSCIYRGKLILSSL